MQYSDSTKLRAYFFGNMYVSPIQHGIQGSHVVTKMFRANQPDLFPADPVMQQTLFDWGDDGVTKIYLNAGYQLNLQIIYDVLSYIAPRLGLPYQKFHEEVDALNGALTSVGVVAPEEVYNLAWDQDFGLLGPLYHKARLPEIPDTYPPSAVYTAVHTKLRSATDNPEDILAMVKTVSDKLTTEEMVFLLHRLLKSAKLA